MLLRFCLREPVSRIRLCASLRMPPTPYLHGYRFAFARKTQRTLCTALPRAQCLLISTIFSTAPDCAATQAAPLCAAPTTFAFGLHHSGHERAAWDAGRRLPALPSSSYRAKPPSAPLGACWRAPANAHFDGAGGGHHHAALCCCSDSTPRSCGTLAS